MDKKIYEDENRLISERRDKLQTIREETNIPFPNNFKPDTRAADLQQNFLETSKADLESRSEKYIIAGRLIRNRGAFLELQDSLALSKGYVKTIFGRKREFKFDKNGLGRLIGKDPYEIDLQSARRAGMEAQSLRAAANAPIQGSSADIIKIAMVKLNKKFIEMNVPAKMLLQVHDELLFEVEPDSLEITTKLVKKTMEDCVKLNVPLLVDIGIGDNWMETK